MHPPNFRVLSLGVRLHTLYLPGYAYAVYIFLFLLLLCQEQQWLSDLCFEYVGNWNYMQIQEAQLLQR